MIISGDRFHYDKDIFRNGNAPAAWQCFLSLYDTHFLKFVLQFVFLIYKNIGGIDLFIIISIIDPI